jgi:hypothetical protein
MSVHFKKSMIFLLQLFCVMLQHNFLGEGSDTAQEGAGVLSQASLTKLCDLCALI